MAWFIIDLPYGNLTGHGVDPEAEYIPIINQFGLVARQMDANECLPLTAVLVGDQPGAVQPVADEIQLTAGVQHPFQTIYIKLFASGAVPYPQTAGIGVRLGFFPQHDPAFIKGKPGGDPGAFGTVFPNRFVIVQPDDPSCPAVRFLQGDRIAPIGHLDQPGEDAAFQLHQGVVLFIGKGVPADLIFGIRESKYIDGPLIIDGQLAIFGPVFAWFSKYGGFFQGGAVIFQQEQLTLASFFVGLNSQPIKAIPI